VTAFRILGVEPRSLASKASVLPLDDILAARGSGLRLDQACL
jgi:hypothetical protein